MNSNIIFSLFGDYRRFNTKNSDLYIKLIEFFVRKGYTPSTSNELILHPNNGQVSTFSMPLFSNNSNMVTMASKQISFQKNNIGDFEETSSMYEMVKKEFSDLINEFVSLTEIEANRIGLNCNIQYDLKDKSIPSCFNLIGSENIKISTIQNVEHRHLNREDINVVVTKSIDIRNQLNSFTIDISSLMENQTLRFKKDNINNWCEEYFKSATEITEEVIKDEINGSTADNNN